MLVTSLDGVFMRVLCALLLVTSFWVLPLALGGDRAAAVLACGMFDGKFECKAAPEGVAHAGRMLVYVSLQRVRLSIEREPAGDDPIEIRKRPLERRITIVVPIDVEADT
jgi:hypothetical protein